MPATLQRIRGGIPRVAVITACLAACPIIHAALIENAGNIVHVQIESRDSGGLIDQYMVLDFGGVETEETPPTVRRSLDREDIVWQTIALGLDRPTRPDILSEGTAELPEHVTRLAEALPENTAVQVRYVALLLEQENSAAAASHLSSTLESYPKNRRLAEVLSGVLAVSGPSDESISRIRSLLDTFPESEIIRFNLACALAGGGLTDQAMQEVAVLAETGWEDLIYHLGDPDLAAIRSDEVFTSMTDILLRKARSRLNRLLLNNPFTPSL